jgi:hypothetical protein
MLPPYLILLILATSSLKLLNHWISIFSFVNAILTLKPEAYIKAYTLLSVIGNLELIGLFL